MNSGFRNGNIRRPAGPGVCAANSNAPKGRAALRKVRANSLRRERAFTLIEVMMVVLIMGLLLAIVVPNMWGQGEKARMAAAKSGIRNIASALDMYRIDNGHYPSTEQGLEALVSKPSGFPEPKHWGPEPYIRKLPLDPWENEFVYVLDGRSFEIISLGQDGTEGGDDLDADIRFSEI